MRNLLFAMAAAAVVVPTLPAMAQGGANREYNRDVREAQREYNQNVRSADSRRDVREARQEYREDVRDARRDRRERIGNWRSARRYDHNRLEPGYDRYYAERYYRDGRFYQPRRLGANERIYRGGDGRYYCRRNDGTTGLLIGAGVGALLGNAIAGGDSGLLGALIGGGAGAVAGREIDRNSVRCR